MRNKKSKTLQAIVLASTIACNACHQARMEAPVVSFKKDMIPILTESCAINGSCHSGTSNRGNNIDFDSAAAYQAIIDNHLVKTATPTASLLYVEVNTGTMPKAPYAQLSQQQQASILNWIEQGGDNN